MAKIKKHFLVFASIAFFLTITYSSVLSTDKTKTLKKALSSNPQDASFRIKLAKALVESNQYDAAEKMATGGQTTVNSKFANLIDQKITEDPQDNIKAISYWENITTEKKDFRDGYLKLALLYYLTYNNQKAEENIQKALQLDPNYELTKKLEEIIKN